MFSLIITIISVALVAAVAVATLFYGGDAFSQSQAQAQAAKIRNQSQQLLGAAEMFKAQFGRYPDDVAELVSEDYLRSDPTAQAAVAAALADRAWFMPVPQQAMFLLEVAAPEACRQVNRHSYGEPGILGGALPGVQTQCYGTSLNQLYGLAQKGSQGLQAWAAADPEMVAVPAPQVVSAVPTSDESTLWTLAPSAPAGAGVLAPSDDDPAPLAGVLSVTTPTVVFATTNVGEHSDSFAILQNTGLGALSISPVTLEGSGAFSVVADRCQGALPADEICSIELRFSPVAEGPATGALTIVSDGGRATVSLSAAGTQVPAGVLDLTSTPAGFPGVAVGATGTQVVTVANTGEGPLSFTAAPSIFGGEGKFTLASTCGESVAAGASCTLTVTFSPTDTVSAVGYLNFDTDVSAPTSLSLTGTGLLVEQGNAVWSASYQEVSAGFSTLFPQVQVGSAAPPQSVYLRNEGTGSLAVSFSLVGDAAHFRLSTVPVASSDQNATADCSAELAGDSKSSTECQALSTHPNIRVSVEYAPIASGSHSVQLVPVTSGAHTMPSALTFSGSAQDPMPGGYVSLGALTFTKPSATKMTWSTANSYCSGGTFWGQTGWRLPTSYEANDLRYAARSPGGTLNLYALGWGSGATDWSNDYYWSATVSSSGHYRVDFGYNGTSYSSAIYNLSDANAQRVTCVKAVD